MPARVLPLVLFPFPFHNVRGLFRLLFHAVQLLPLIQSFFLYQKIQINYMVFTVVTTRTQSIISFPEPIEQTTLIQGSPFGQQDLVFPSLLRNN